MIIERYQTGAGVEKLAALIQKTIEEVNRILKKLASTATSLKFDLPSRSPTLRMVGYSFPLPTSDFRVERFVTSPLPHRPVRAAFPHTVPLI